MGEPREFGQPGPASRHPVEAATAIGAPFTLLSMNASKKAASSARASSGRTWRDILVRPHDDDAALLAIDATHVENVVPALEIRAEHLLVVAEPVTALPRQKELGHVFELQLPVGLLEDGAHVDDGVDVRARRRVPSQRRVGRACEVFAQRARPRRRARGIVPVGEDEEPPAAVRLDRMTKMHGPWRRRALSPAPSGSACRS